MRKIIKTVSLVFLVSGCLYCRESINLNTAMLNNLTFLPGINEKRAREIIQYRDKNKEFKSVDELKDIIGSGKLKRLRKEVDVYAVSKQVWESGIASSSDSLQSSQLKIETLPLTGNSMLVTFPDDKIMLVDTGSEKDSEKVLSLLGKDRKMVDWVVVTSLSERCTGGLKSILGNYTVKELITGLTIKQLQKDTELNNILDSNLARKVIHTNFTAYSEREVPPVRLVFVGPEYSQEDPSICLKIIYDSVSFLYMSDIDNNTQKRILGEYKNTVKNTVLFSGENLTGEFKNAVDAKIVSQPNKGNVFITDGRLAYVSENSGVSIAPAPLTEGQLEMQRLKEELDLAKKKAEELRREAERKKREEEELKRKQQAESAKKLAEEEKKKAAKKKSAGKKEEKSEEKQKIIPKSYTVLAGDTLPIISEKVYGDSGQWAKIYEANKDKIMQGQVEVGQVLTIP
ncbi:MAG: helix-hairpin-helix domain-containing protein [Elusimicrobia bacterium]|nr:helix-hairpin-helix domain-containing protein [Elusimicrobiota bacterium]